MRSSERPGLCWSFLGKSFCFFKKQELSNPSRLACGGGVNVAPPSPPQSEPSQDRSRTREIQKLGKQTPKCTDNSNIFQPAKVLWFWFGKQFLLFIFLLSLQIVLLLLYLPLQSVPYLFFLFFSLCSFPWCKTCWVSSHSLKKMEREREVGKNSFLKKRPGWQT